jgi:hypothetical protein
MNTTVFDKLEPLIEIFNKGVDELNLKKEIWEQDYFKQLIQHEEKKCRGKYFDQFCTMLSPFLGWLPRDIVSVIFDYSIGENVTEYSGRYRNLQTIFPFSSEEMAEQFEEKVEDCGVMTSFWLAGEKKYSSTIDNHYFELTVDDDEDRDKQITFIDDIANREIILVKKIGESDKSDNPNKRRKISITITF